MKSCNANEEKDIHHIGRAVFILESGKKGDFNNLYKYVSESKYLKSVFFNFRDLYRATKLAQVHFICMVKRVPTTLFF